MAMLARAENRMLALHAVARGAARAGVALVAGVEADVVEVMAARALHQIAADRRHIAQLRRGAGQQRGLQQRIVRAHQRMICGIGIADHRANADAAIGRCIDACQRQPADIDQPLWPFDAGLDQIEQIGAARDEARAGLLAQLQRRVEAVGAVVVE